MHRVILLALGLFLFLPPTLPQAQRTVGDLDTAVREGIVEINQIMVAKDRVKALEAIDDVLKLLDSPESRALVDVRENLVRLKYYLSKYNWDRARRILKGVMEELALDYQPTHP